MHTFLRKILRDKTGKVSTAKVGAIGILGVVFLAFALRVGFKMEKNLS